MKKNDNGFFEGYEPKWMTDEGGNKGLTAEDRHRANAVAMAQGQAAEVRARRPEMQVKKLA